MTSPLLPPGIQVRDLSLRFGQQIVFDRLSFDIAGGSFVALLGASGAGKTSLLKIIAGLERATSGTVTGSDGLPIAGRIAYMGQKDLLYPWLTVEENVALGSRLRGETPDRAWV
ncbi:TPA: ATP-binding cassette domain-containing protein, partial [Serratia marcescens]